MGKGIRVPPYSRGGFGGCCLLCRFTYAHTYFVCALIEFSGWGAGDEAEGNLVGSSERREQWGVDRVKIHCILV